MSTIAWDGKSLAGDRKCNDRGVMRLSSKVERTEAGEFIADVGSVAGALLLKEWYKSGAKRDDFPKEISTDKHDSTIIVLRLDGTIVEYDNECRIAFPVMDKFFAWGSGRLVALGAMAMGADAKKAVEIAAMFDAGTGFGVDVVSPGD